MIYSLKLAKNESNFESDFEHPTFQGVLYLIIYTQGAAALALGYVLTGPSARAFQLISVYSR